MSNYTITRNVWGHDTVYTIRLKKPHAPLNIEQRQAPFAVPHVHWLKGGVKPKSDWMRQRSYRAETNLCNSEQKRWDDFLQVAHYLGTLMETEWFGRRWPDFRELRVIYRKKKRNACAGPKLSASTGVMEGSMTLSRWAIGDNPGKRKDGGEAVILHELAHAICPRAHQHSPLWARTYLELVHFRMGAASADLLKKGYDEHKVRYRPYRQLTEAQRQALRDRFVNSGLNRKPDPATVASEGVVINAQD